MESNPQSGTTSLAFCLSPSPAIRSTMSSDALVNGVAGACGGILAQFLTYPLQAVSLATPCHDLELASAEAGSWSFMLPSW